MAQSLPLPSGALVTLRDPADVTERARRAVRVKWAEMSLPMRLAWELPTGTPDELAARDRAINEALNPEDILTTSDLAHLSALAVVERWSFDRPITIDELLDLPGRDYDALMAGTSKLQARLILGVDTGPNPDPDSPTGGSVA